MAFAEEERAAFLDSRYLAMAFLLRFLRPSFVVSEKFPLFA
jgi:hypothetical protein